jgi:hypothetical protein
VADELAAPEYLRLRVRLLIYALQWTSPYEELAEVADLLADRPLVVASAVEQLSIRLTNSKAYWTPADLFDPAVRLAMGGRAADGLFALTLTAAATRHAGWSPAWRTLLTDLRNHPADDVRHAALDVVTAAEGW